MFALVRDNHYLHAAGMKRRLPPGPAVTLEDRVARFFAARADDPEASLLVGALPFDLSADSALYQPKEVRRGTGLGPFALNGATQATRPWAAKDVIGAPDAAHFADMVRRALDRAAQGKFVKVVLSRSLRILASNPVNPVQVAHNLAADTTATTFLVTLPNGDLSIPSTLVGATPELLVSRQGSQVFSHPLAGSAARRSDNSEDQAAAEALLRSDKDHREHALVVEAILDTLAPYCVNLGVPDGTTLHSTATMWHLGTRISGELRDDAPSSAGLAALLHPTPAVGGSPRQPALQAIRELEPQDRGFYAGAVGWTDQHGDGEWHVSIRCAEICGSQLTLHAGAGIVIGSDPDAEVAETAAKFRAMLRALEMDEQEGALELVV